ncbi:D-arabinono-1,4-lactone oxidase [Ferdinandcohnia quinoae]|uniref:FAD-binding protein n=1 Tax=Fredinandcohnia quinoae TaxID=2918902 RepID=A0AAW5DYM7_9BACI|nr:D-arabinono-1,4-lactone oxidase [Fredinandcohnia sp. SECRCQ15]MCH1625478.1 FAD-binding protein [Fredinandcohnia sp. SECRCQ15]
MKKMKQGQTWKNWAHTSESTPERIFYPATIEEVCEIVKDAGKQKKSIRVVGAGHSFTKLVQTDVWLMSLDLLSGIDSIDEENGTVTVLGGTRLFQIGEELGKRGYAQENLGDINVQSIAGAISTGTHGTGIEFGNVSTQAIEIVLVTASGTILTISEKENSEYYKAALVSLGSLGIIVKVTLKIISCPIYEYTSQKVHFSQLEKQLKQFVKSNRHFECYLFPYSDIVQVKTMNISERKPQSLKLHHFQNLLLENYLFFLISEMCRLFPKSSRFFSRLSAKAVGSSSIVAHSYQLFATPRIVRFREIEYCIPLEHMGAALIEVRNRIEEKKHKVHFPIECRTVKADDIWLSPSYERESAYIAFHMYKGMPYESYFRDMEEIMKKYEGRPHWGKMHNRKFAELSDTYPKLPEFLEIRQELDPNGVFLNEYVKKLLSIS